MEISASKVLEDFVPSALAAAGMSSQAVGRRAIAA
jgi:hypothetical protein